MSDYIKREDALNAFRRVYMIPGQGTAKEIYAKQIENTYKQIESVPCADVVERKHGKWERAQEQPYFRKHFDIVVCSCCHNRGNKKWNFCPNCGTDMRGDNDV